MSLTAEATETIHAPIERVWRAVVHLDEYAAWNPFTPEVRNARKAEPARVGDIFTFVVRWADGAGTFISPERVLEVAPPHRDDQGIVRATFVYRFAHWIHGPYLIRATRSTWLEQRDGAPTTYRTFERMRGLLAPLAPIDKVRAGFVAQARALKQHCER